VPLHLYKFSFEQHVRPLFYSRTFFPRALYAPLLAVTLISSSVAVGALSGCAKSKDPAPVIPTDSLKLPNGISIQKGQRGPIMVFPNTPQIIDSLMNLPKAERPDDPVAALKQMLAFNGPSASPSPGTPPAAASPMTAQNGMPAIPPHLMSPENVVLSDMRDNNAMLTYRSGISRMQYFALLTKHTKGTESVWVINSIEEDATTGPIRDSVRK
jgi:hypothetical protein